MIYEDDVVNAVATYLQQDGWQIVSKALAHQRGDDIVATRNGRRLIVEAKGEGSSKTRTGRFGNAFNASQVDSHIGRALTRLLAVWSSGEASAALALPDNVLHRRRINLLARALSELDVDIYWVDTNGRVSRNGEVAG